MLQQEINNIILFKLVLREKINKTCIICSLAKISHRNKEWMNDKI